MEYAKKRRGIELVHADGQDLPFTDETYSTVILASGVVDFLEDEELINKIINEARRVAKKSGVVLVAFYCVYPVLEKFSRQIGIITPNGKALQKRMYELTRLNPIEFIQWIRKEVGFSLFKTICMFMHLQFFLPPKEKKASKSLSKLWKVAEDPDALINAACETLPYRDTQEIKNLMTRLKIHYKNYIEYDSCKVFHL